MKQTLTEKILSAHLTSGILTPGNEIGLRIDQTLTQDSTGTMAYLQWEAIGIPKVKTSLSVAYVDHNTLQCGYENGDDHRYIESVAARSGIVFSKPGNGICHQVHLERFGKPGQTLLGSDSHTPTAGALGMLAMGAGGLDVAVAMAGGSYHIHMPAVCRIELTGQLSPGVSAKDCILELLRRIGVKGGVGKIFEYGGDGLRFLSVPSRATIANMGAETGATTSIFPSDEVTREFLRSQGREEDWSSWEADQDAQYSEIISIDLASLVPLVAQPSSPDNVVPLDEIAGLPLDQILIGSCTNSSFDDLRKVSAILKGKKIHPRLSLGISPGSRQVLGMLADCGALGDLIRAGARILECACGPCIGMGQSPESGGVSLRTFNRNFPGRSGTADAQVYLSSPEVAAASALSGVLTDPRSFCQSLSLSDPANLLLKANCNDHLFIKPTGNTASIPIRRGPNIKPFPLAKTPADSLQVRVVMKAGNNITTDHIMPSPAHLLPYRSNIPHLAQFCFHPLDPEFAPRALDAQESIIIAGTNYGQGSSREHAALAPLYLGVRAVIAQSYARIHRANLINFGILPFTFVHEEDYHHFALGDMVCIHPLISQLKSKAPIKITSNNRLIFVQLDVTEREREIILAGGLLNFSRDEEVAVHA